MYTLKQMVETHSFYYLSIILYILFVFIYQ